jgi:hypothetical protein
MAIECASTVEICAVRATRLDTDGTVSPDADNVYVVQDVIQLQFTPNIREGEERELIGGCGGCPIASKTDDDSLRRFDLELQSGRLEPGLIEMLTGGTVIEDTNGPIGFLFGEKRECGVAQPRVAFEAWSKRWTADDEQDPAYPWWHWVWPSVAWVPGQNTLQADFGPVVLTGKSRVNTSWGSGPYGDQPASTEGAQLGVWASAGDLPTATCDYSTVTT